MCTDVPAYLHSPRWNAANNECAIPVLHLVKTPEKAHVLAPSKPGFGKRLADGSPPRKPRFCKLLKVPEDVSAEDALGLRLERPPPLYVRRPDLDLALLDELVRPGQTSLPTRADAKASLFGALEDHWADAAASSRPLTPPLPCRVLPSAQMVPPSPARQTHEAMRRNPSAIIRLDLGRSGCRRQNLQERHLRLLAAENAVA